MSSPSLRAEYTCQQEPDENRNSHGNSIFAVLPTCGCIVVVPLLKNSGYSRVQGFFVNYRNRCKAALIYSRLFGARAPANSRVASGRVLDASALETPAMATFHLLNHVPVRYIRYISRTLCIGYTTMFVAAYFVELFKFERPERMYPCHSWPQSWGGVPHTSLPNALLTPVYTTAPY